MKIQVTQEHLDKGAPGECNCCPVALAMEAVGFTNVSVLDLYISYGPDSALEVDTPQEVLDFMSRFDDVVSDFPAIADWNKSMFEPFEFELPVEAAA